MAVSEVHEAILANVPERLFGITGVGRKTAARIILELRDKILKLAPVGSAVASATSQRGGFREDAVNALMTLGFARPVANQAVGGILELEPDASLEDVIKSALAAMHNR